jgi:hypothetical protein
MAETHNTFTQFLSMDMEVAPARWTIPSDGTTTCQEDWRAANEVQNRGRDGLTSSCWMTERVAADAD